MSIGDRIVAAARECLGTPFVHQGRLPGRALDCAGVAVHACRQCGLTALEPQGYGRQPHDGMLEMWLERQPFLARAPLADMHAGDLLLMRFTGEPQHIAIATDAGILHSYEKAGRVVEHVLDPRWRKRIVRVYRFIEVNP